MMSRRSGLHPCDWIVALGVAALLMGCTNTQTAAPDAEPGIQPAPLKIGAASEGERGVVTHATEANPQQTREPLPKPRIVKTGQFLQCVPYARRLSGLPIYGNAATWWLSAYGMYRRSKQPEPGAVMVFRSSHRNPFGHLAVVNTVVNNRKILVNHANWLNDGRIHRATPVVDVSPGNDWSAVRVWYIPGHRLGAHTFPVYGFILQEKLPPGELFQTIANTNVRKGPSRKARRVGRLPKQTTVELLERAPKRPWFKVAHDGREIGYIFAPLVEPIQSKPEVLSMRPRRPTEGLVH